MSIAVLNSLSIHRLVSILSGLGIVAVLLIGGLSYVTYQSLEARSQAAAEAQAQARDAARLDHTLSEAKFAEAPILRRRDSGQIQAGLAKLEKAHQQYAQGLTPIAQSLGEWPVQQQQVQALQREHKRYAQQAVALLQRWQSAPSDDTHRQLASELEQLEVLFRRLEDHNQVFQGAIHARTEEALAAAQNHLQQTRWVVMVVAAVVAVGLFVVSLFIVKAILKPIRALSDLIENSHRSGTFRTDLETPVAGEVGHMVSNYQQFMHTIQQAMQEAIEVSQASAKGQFQLRMQGDYNGDLAALKTGINASAAGVHRTSSALGEIMQALARGDFSQRLSDEVPQSTREQVNQALDVLCGALDEVDEVLNALSCGDFSQRVGSPLPGRLRELKDNINRAMDETDVAMRDATRVMEQLASGHLNASDNREHPGRFGDLMKAVSATVTKLRGTMQGIVQTSRLVSDTSDNITHSSHELSDTAQAQLSSVKDIEPALERMGEGADRKLAFTEQANQLVLQATTQAHDGSSVVQEATEAMQALNEASKRIADITGIIDGIASQTNLLALNASVEAARAGEQGRGFAVVATEVGNLAQRSATSAREIKSLIEDSVGKVHSSTQLVDRTGEQLQEILQSVGQVKSTMGQIVGEEKKQAQDIQHIRELVEHVVTSSDKNSDCCSRVSRASDKMKAEADVLRKDIEYFSF